MSETLVIRRLADKSVGQRISRRNALTGKQELFNPETGRAEGWPFLGIQLGHIPVGKSVASAPVWEPPKVTGVSQKEVLKGINEGYITLENQSAITCPSGPPGDPWGGNAPNHEMVQATHIVFKCVSEQDHRSYEVRYEVTRAPGKYYESDGKLVNKDLSRYGEPANTFHDFRLKLAE